jgi:F-box-like
VLIDQGRVYAVQVLAVLDPLSLAAAACVCRQWRAASDASPAWQSISTGVCAAMPWQAGHFRAGHKAGFITLARGAARGLER